MLLSFRVANHRSFHGEQELLLLPAYDKSTPAVPVAAIYGANASGKSNLLDALRAMRTAVLNSFSQWEPLGGVPRDPFALAGTAREAESRFGVDLLLGGQKYVYGFAINDARVIEEWLYHYPHGRRRILFEREADDFSFGDSLRGPKNLIEEVTRPNSLFLSAAAHHGLEQLLPIYSWFARHLTFTDPSDHKYRRNRTLQLLQRPTTARRIVKLLKAADLGINDILIRRGQFPRSGGEVEADDAGRVTAGIGSGNTEMMTQLAMSDVSSPAGNAPDTEQLPSRVTGLFTELRRRGRAEIVMVRNTPEGPIPLSLEQESNGTQTWFDFLGLITDALDNGWLVSVDELDASLHPLLAREFVRMFQSPATNPHNAQLVFTTHDTSLLARHGGEETLRRDEVWFTEKNQAGETRLYPLTDFKPRSGLNWERRYLGGSVGAVPFLEEEEFEAALDNPRTAHG